jgi:hypothetical protein
MTVLALVAVSSLRRRSLVLAFARISLQVPVTCFCATNEGLSYGILFCCVQHILRDWDHCHLSGSARSDCPESVADQNSLAYA